MRLPADALLGEENKGFAILMDELPRERLGIAAQAVAASEGALDITIDYVKERKPSDRRSDSSKTRVLSLLTSKPGGC